VAPDAPCLATSHPRHAIFCEWAAAGDPVHLRHIVAVSGMRGPIASPPDGPGLLTKAANFGKAIVSHVAAGRPAADAATVEFRWATCRACPMFDAAGVVCRACGCHLEIKIRWAEQRCPIGKW
jgi:hypothetical protein